MALMIHRFSVRKKKDPEGIAYRSLCYTSKKEIYIALNLKFHWHLKI
jgi:hypothetical protein